MKSVRLTALLLGALVLGFATPGHALNLTLSVDDGGAPLTCADGAACDSNGVAGVITFHGAFGVISVSVGGTASGAPALGPLDMDLSYNLTAPVGSAAGTFHIQVSQNGLSTPGASFNALIDGNQTNGATTAFASFADAGNTLFATTTPLCSAGPVATQSVHLTCSSGLFSDASFSLTERITIVTQAGITTVSGDALLISSVPEPATVMLLGIALTGVGLSGYLRARRRSA